MTNPFPSELTAISQSVMHFLVFRKKLISYSWRALKGVWQEFLILKIFYSWWQRSFAKVKVTVQFEQCFRLMEHISVFSWPNPINLYITVKLIKLSKSLLNFYSVISNKWRERTPCFPTFAFPLRSSKSDMFTGKIRKFTESVNLRFYL